jgi:hypothetical protein
MGGSPGGNIMGKTLVRFSRSPELRGEVVHTDDERRKIVFLAGYRPETAGSWRGQLPTDGSTWVVDVVRDTKPDQSGRGALIVRLVRPVEWDLAPVGEEVGGVREMRPVCLDDEALPSVYCTDFSREEIGEANEPWREAVAREVAVKKAAETVTHVWVHGGADDFFKEFGHPHAVTPQEDGTVVLSYPRGEKTVRGWGILGWLSHISQPKVRSWSWDDEAQSAKVLFSFADLGVTTAVEVCRLDSLVHGNLPPLWEQVSSEMKAEIVSFVREHDLLSPVTWAERRWASTWDYGSQSLDRDVVDPLLALAHPGVSEITNISRSEQVEVMSSYRGETWGSGHYVNQTYTVTYLVCGVSEVSRGSWRGPMGCYNIACYGNTVEAARREILEGAVKKFANSFLQDRWLSPASDFFQGEKHLSDWRDSYRQAYITARRETLTKWWSTVAERMAADREAVKLSEQLDALADEACPGFVGPFPKGENLNEIREEIARISLLGELSREVNTFRERYQAVRSSREWYGLDAELSGQLERRFDHWASTPSTVEEMVTWRAKTETLFAKLDAQIIELERQREVVAQAQERVRVEAEARGSQAFLPQQEDMHEIDPRIISFAKDVQEIVGTKQGIDILREELGAPYGRARRQEAILLKMPGIDSTDAGYRFLLFGRARDVDAWLEGAVAWLEGALTMSNPTNRVATPQPTVPTVTSTEPVDLTKVDLSVLFGGGGRVK